MIIDKAIVTIKEMTNIELIVLRSNSKGKYVFSLANIITISWIKKTIPDIRNVKHHILNKVKSDLLYFIDNSNSL